MTHSNAIPQLITIGDVSRAGKITLKREVRRHLAVEKGQPLYLVVDGEVLLTPRKSKQARPAELRGGGVILPEDVLKTLQIEGGSSLATVQRDGAVALKKIVLEEKDGLQAQITDVETPLQITRVATTNLPPGQLLAALQKKYAGKKLKADVRKFLKGRQALAAWQARKLLDCPDADDARLQKQLIAERLARQEADGSWEGKVPTTARILKELAELGVSPRRKEAKAAAEWLLARDESPVNLGMFFLSDELVALQKKRLREHARFRDRKDKEIRLAVEGHDLFRNCCGQRIMWPNAVVLDALIRMGYEKHPRVQTALKTTAVIRWCECGAQHGIGKVDNMPSPAEIEKRVDAVIAQMTARGSSEYRYGGLNGPEDVLRCTLPRISHKAVRGKDVYTLVMPWYVDTCGLISMRAFAGIKDSRLRKRAEAGLGWLVGLQQPDGRIDCPRNFEFLHSADVVFLSTLAMFDHPISRVGIMRYAPWIVANQNRDGSWGDEEHKDAATLAMLQTLVAARDYLPKGMRV